MRTRAGVNMLNWKPKSDMNLLLKFAMKEALDWELMQELKMELMVRCIPRIGPTLHLNLHLICFEFSWFFCRWFCFIVSLIVSSSFPPLILYMGVSCNYIPWLKGLSQPPPQILHPQQCPRFYIQSKNLSTKTRSTRSWSTTVWEKFIYRQPTTMWAQKGAHI